MMNITDLPTEILEKIFKFLLQRKPIFDECNNMEILKLTMVCKRFNQVVEGNDRLMASLHVHWMEKKEEDIDTLLDSHRIYRRVKFKNGSPEQIGRYLQTRSNIKRLSIQSEPMQLSILLNILHNARDSLEDLRIAYLWLIQSKPEHKISLPKLKTLYLGSSSIYTAVRCIESLENLEEIDYDSDGGIFEHGKGTVKKFANLINNCTRLKKMTLTGYEEALRIFKQSIFANEHKFQLTSLSLRTSYVNFSRKEVENFRKFMSKQVLLEKLKLRDVILKDELLIAILCLPSLKNLKLREFRFKIKSEFSVTSTSIVTLKLQYYGICGDDKNNRKPDWIKGFCKIIESCPNVRTLILSAADLKHVAGTINKYLTRLEELELYLCDEISPVSIPTVKTITLNPKFCEPEDYLEEYFNAHINMVLDFIRLNPQLTLIKCPRRLEQDPRFDISNISFTKQVKIMYCQFWDLE